MSSLLKTETIEPLKGLDASKAVDNAISYLQQCPSWNPGKGEDIVYELPSDFVGKLEITPKTEQNVFIILKKGCEATILEKGTGDYTVDIILHENSKAHYFSESTNVSVRRHAHLLNDSSILWIDVGYGNIQTETDTYLAGKGSDSQFESVFLGKDNEKCEIKSSMIHAGNNSTSNMLTRAVMLGESQGKYAGMIRIEEQARGCDAYQKEETILLSSKAKMDAQPNLEISNEEVSCSHGVSLGQLDEEMLFYFRSRGIPKDSAVQLIIHGFFDAIISRMGTEGQSARESLFSRV